MKSILKEPLKVAEALTIGKMDEKVSMETGGENLRKKDRRNTSSPDPYIINLHIIDTLLNFLILTLLSEKLKTFCKIIWIPYVMKFFF